jgi:signal transduction histidine kinase
MEDLIRFNESMDQSLTTSVKRPGSIGLGLYIAREIVTAHGGSIDVRSSAEEGTVFTVRLPRRAATC